MDEIELKGRIEALGKFVLQLAAELEMSGVIDGPRFSHRLRGERRMKDQIPHIQRGRECLAEMLDALDEARRRRSDVAIQVGRH